MHGLGIDRCHYLCCGVSYNLSPFNPPITQKTFGVTFDGSGEWAGRQLFLKLNACSLYFKIMAALQTDTL